MTRLSDWTNTKDSYYVCLKDRKKARRPKAVMAALCGNCRRTCELAGKPRRGPRKIKSEGKTDKLVNLWRLVDDYIDTYELRSDDGDYVPTKTERVLIRDAFYGLIEEEGFIRKWDAWRTAVNESKKETKP